MDLCKSAVFLASEQPTDVTGGFCSHLDITCGVSNHDVTALVEAALSPPPPPSLWTNDIYHTTNWVSFDATVLRSGAQTGTMLRTDNEKAVGNRSSHLHFDNFKILVYMMTVG